MVEKNRKYIYFFLFLIAICEIVIFAKAVENKKGAQVLGIQSTATPTIMATITPMPTDLPTILPSPTPKPTITPSPLPKKSSEEIYKFIENHASTLGVDPNVIRHIALCESGFNPQATNLNYRGLFQFNKTTWENLRRQMGEGIDENLRTNAFESVKTAVYAVSKGIKGIWPNCYP